MRNEVHGGARPVDDVTLLVAQFSGVDIDALGLDATSLVKEWCFHSSDAYTAHMSRQELMKFIRRFADAEPAYTTELILGEILANTVELAPGLVEVKIDWTNEKPVVTVLDTDQD